MYRFRIYTSGKTARSMDAVNTFKSHMKADFPGKCSFEVVDVLENSEAANRDDVLATPTVIRVKPLPERRILGDFRDKIQVFRGLGIKSVS